MLIGRELRGLADEGADGVEIAFDRADVSRVAQACKTIADFLPQRFSTRQGLRHEFVPEVKGDRDTRRSIGRNGASQQAVVRGFAAEIANVRWHQ